MTRGNDRLAVLAHGSEAGLLDGDLLHTERAGAFTKQREHLVPLARLDFGKAVIHLTQDLAAEDALQWASIPTLSVKARRRKGSALAPSFQRLRTRSIPVAGSGLGDCREQLAGTSVLQA